MIHVVLQQCVLFAHLRISYRGLLVLKTVQQNFMARQQLENVKVKQSAFI